MAIGLVAIDVVAGDAGNNAGSRERFSGFCGSEGLGLRSFDAPG